MIIWLFLGLQYNTTDAPINNQLPVFFKQAYKDGLPGCDVSGETMRLSDEQADCLRDLPELARGGVKDLNSCDLRIHIPDRGR